MNEDIDRLKAQLLTSGIQSKNPALYQVINQLIGLVKALRVELNGLDTEESVVAAQTIINQIILSGTDNSGESESFPIPGPPGPIGPTGPSGGGSSSSISAPNIDDSYDPEPMIMMIENPTSSSVLVEWSVLTNGDATSPELIFAGGDVIMTHLP